MLTLFEALESGAEKEGSERLLDLIVFTVKILWLGDERMKGRIVN